MMGSLERTVSVKTYFSLFTASRLQRFFPALVLVFEYDGFSGEGPVNLFIEENLLQRAPRPRTRVGLRSFPLRTTGSVQSYKKTSQSKLPKETELTLETHNENTSDAETKSSDVSADTQHDKSIMGRVTFGPTGAVHTRTMSQTSQTVADGGWPVPLTAEPADASSVSPKETIQSSHNIRVKSKFLLLNGMETSGLKLKDPTQTTHDSSAANPNTLPLNATTDAFPTSRPSSAPTQPTFITYAKTDATTPQEESNPTHGSSSTLPSVTSIPVPTSTSTEAATNTKQVAQVKKKYRISWEEEKVEDELLNMSEPMQRQEESTSGKPGKYIHTYIYTIYCNFTVVLECLRTL